MLSAIDDITNNGWFIADINKDTWHLVNDSNNVSCLSFNVIKWQNDS